MLLAAAVCPAPPFLIDGVGGTVHPLPELAEACAAVVDRVAAVAMGVAGAGATTGGDQARVVVVGEGPETREWPLSTGFSAAGFTGTRPIQAEPELPPALGLGRQLATAAGLEVTTLHAVSPSLTRRECEALGASLVEGSRPVVLLVVADGSACRTEKAPGYFDPRAEAFDRTWVAAVAAGDPAPLLTLDPAVADELRCSGRAPLQVLAGSVRAGRGPHADPGNAISSQVAYEGAPFGVQYLAASWELPRA